MEAKNKINLSESSSSNPVSFKQMIYNNFVSDVYADAPQEVKPLMYERNQTQDVSNKFKLIRHHSRLKTVETLKAVKDI